MYPAPYGNPPRRIWPWVIGGAIVIAGVTIGGVLLATRVRASGLEPEAAKDIWLYTTVAIIPGAGPWQAGVIHKGDPDREMPDEGWKVHMLPGTYISQEGAVEGAKKFIREQGGTPMPWVD